MPSVETTTEPPPVQLLMPDRASVQVKPTVTFVLFHVKPLGAGLREATIDGGVLSSLTTSSPLPTLPTLSVAVEVFVMPAKSVSVVTLSVAGVGPVLMPEPPSIAVQLIVVLTLRQPSALAAGVPTPVTTGGPLSTM